MQTLAAEERSEFIQLSAWVSGARVAAVPWGLAVGRCHPGVCGIPSLHSTGMAQASVPPGGVSASAALRAAGVLP